MLIERAADNAAAMSYSLESLMASTGRSQQAVAAVEATDQRRDFVEAVLKREARQQEPFSVVILWR